MVGESYSLNIFKQMLIFIVHIQMTAYAVHMLTNYEHAAGI